MKITLPPRLDTFVKEKVESGLYRDASEVISEALRLLHKDDELDQLRAVSYLGGASELNALMDDLDLDDLDSDRNADLHSN